MATTDRSPTNPTTRSLVSWSRFLDQEAQRLADLGLRAGVLTIDVQPESRRDASAPATSAEVARVRTVQLLRSILGRTDRFAVTSESKIAVLHAPVESLADLNDRAWAIARDLHRAGVDAAIGFAHRRQDEPLLDTWARADAEADRIHFRRNRSGGGLSIG